VIFTGLLRGRRRLEALADADVVVYPSQDEIFGLVPLEALLMGSPVIVAGDSGCGEVVARMGGGQVVAVGDDAALAVAIVDILEKPDYWRSVANGASERVRASYGQDIVCAALENVYFELAAERATGRAPDRRATMAGRRSVQGTCE
jgi:glycosyltransferase involved in cell wall biosynthesis